MRKHSKKHKVVVVNAMDHLDVPLPPVVMESTPLPEITSDFMDLFPDTQTVQDDQNTDWMGLFKGIDLWVEIQKYLTPREFQVFEMSYRYQMPHYDIARILGISYQLVFKLLSKSKKKLRLSFDKKTKKRLRK